MLRYNRNRLLMLIGIIILTSSLYMLYYNSNYEYLTKQKFINSNLLFKNKDIYPSAVEKANASFVILMKNDDINDFRKTMQQLEDRFNHKYNYPYVFLNNKPFTEKVKRYLKAQTKAKVEFGLIPKDQWGIPDFLDKKKVKDRLLRLDTMNVPYGGKMSYHHMCRYESGLFAQHELLAKYEYYWRVEPNVEFMCDINEDPFMYMKNNNKKYGFTIVMSEYMETIPTLYSTIKEWIKDSNIKLPKDNLYKWVINKKGNYNGNHFWSNFEIGSLDMLRSEQYLNYFNYLDQSGGFYYERWGDAPVHSLYVALMLNKTDIHFFKDIGYKHDLFFNCPIEMHTNLQLKCYCEPKHSSNFGNLQSIRLLEELEDPYVEMLK